MGLGSYREMSLAEARERAAVARKMVRDGLDPIADKRGQRTLIAAAVAKTLSFEKAAELYIEAHEKGWSNPKHAQQWASTLRDYAYPHIGNMNVALIDTRNVLAVLNPIWGTKTETAKRLRGRIEKILNYCKTSGYRTGENPARWKGHLDQTLGAPNKISPVEHHAALPFKEIGGFMQALRQQAGIGAAALEFTILTAARSGETRGAVWSEFDLEAKRWSIPAARMKAKRGHDVPLSDAAIAVIKRMQENQFGDLVFPGRKQDRPLSDMSLTAVLKRMGRGDLTAHGFRSSFRDWASELTSYPHDMCEMALAHAVGDAVEAAYRRGDLYQKRVGMMQDWAAYCDTVQPAEAEVNPIKRRKAVAA